MLNIRENIDILTKEQGISSKIDVYMNKLYRRIDDELACFDNKCENCKRCCNFEISKLDLFVSNIEFAYFIIHISDIRKPTNNICPYLTDSGCAVREFRPIGCRTYFCKPANSYSQSNIYERSLNDIKEFVRTNNLSYIYYPWLRFLDSYWHSD